MPSRTLTIAQARRVALAAQGFADPRPRAVGRDHAPRPARHRPRPGRPDRQRQRRLAQPLPAVLRAARALRPRPRRPRLQPRPAAARRVLGAHGQPRPADDLAAARLPDAPGRGGGLGRRPDGPPRVPGARRRRPRRGRAPRADDLPRGGGRAGPRRSPQPRPLGLELVGGQDLPRAALPVRPDQLGRPHQPVRTPVCVAGRRSHRPAVRDRWVDPDPPSRGGGGDPRAGPPRGAGARRRHRALPARLLPAQVRPGPSGHRATSSRPGSSNRSPSPAGTSRPGCTPRHASRGGSTRRRCSAPSTRWSGSANAPRRSTTCATGSRSTRRSTSGSTATTCCPFLYGDNLVARVDLKADRAAGVLRLNQVTWQPGAPAEARPALLRNLASMADWLGLDDGVVEAVPA